MVNAANDSTIKIRHQTQNKFWVDYENQFLVLPDAKTVVGADASFPKKLMVEVISQGNPRQIGTHGGLIETVLFHSLTQSLLVGGKSGHVKHYQKMNQSFTMVKDYGDVGVGLIYSSTQVGLLAVFGGSNRLLVAIDICKQRVCPGRLKSPFGSTYSLQVCQGTLPNVYLSVGGRSPKYSSDASDFLDVTLLYNDHAKDSPKFLKSLNHANALLEEKDRIIDSLNLKIKRLELFLQKQADRNQGKNNTDIKNQNKCLEQKIENLVTDLETAEKKIASLRSQKTKSNVAKRNLLIQQVMTKNRHRKKTTETKTSSDAIDQEETKDETQLKEKNDFLKQMVRTQTTQIQQLYTRIVNLQEKEVEHQKSIEAYDKLDQYHKKMTENSKQVKIFW